MKTYKDLTGEKFSKLVVLGLEKIKRITPEHARKRTYYYWKCRCECGREVIRDTASLRRKGHKSCEHCRLYKQIKDLTGKRFSKLVVLERAGSKTNISINGTKRTVYYWKCKCDCGQEVIRSGDALRNGNTKSCGCNHIHRRNNETKFEVAKNKNIENEEEFE